MATGSLKKRFVLLGMVSALMKVLSSCAVQRWRQSVHFGHQTPTIGHSCDTLESHLEVETNGFLFQTDVCTVHSPSLSPSPSLSLSLSLSFLFRICAAYQLAKTRVTSSFRWRPQKGPSPLQPFGRSAAPVNTEFKESPRLRLCSSEV